jgi:8-oxo-dGTP pyrophosphatase MutT (NUDIX family)
MTINGFTVDRLAERLKHRRQKRVYRLVRARYASVAALFDVDGNVLLTRRAERKGDRWSAHVSLPGGMQHAGEASLEETARRETLEEVGIDLRECELLGALDETRATVHGGFYPLAIAGFVWLTDKQVTPSLSNEVTRAFWFPLRRAGEFNDKLTWPVFGVKMNFPCWRYDGETIWGLTHGILSKVIKLGS